MGNRPNYNRYGKRRHGYERSNYQGTTRFEVMGELMLAAVFGFGRWIGELFGRRRNKRALDNLHPTERGRPLAPPPLSQREFHELAHRDPNAIRPPITRLSDVKSPPMPYRRASSILSKGERAFWYPLYRAVKGKYRIFCKVRLADVVCCPPKRDDERRWFKKIGRYHVHFVICDPKTTAPLLVIELDDRRHRAARMPLYRVRAQRAYDLEELRREIERRIGIA